MENTNDNKTSLPYINKVKKYNLISAYIDMFYKFDNFKGRSRRSEFFYATLLDIIIIVAYMMIFIFLGYFGYEYDFLTASETERLGIMYKFVYLIYCIITFIPRLSLTVRRLHDTGRSGWWLLVGLIPYGVFVVLLFLVTESDPCINKYGTNPKGQYYNKKVE